MLLQETAEEFINPRFRALSAAQIDEKGPGDLVTVADREAETAITRVLHDAYPSALVLGEEASAADPSILRGFEGAEHAFTIDPIDGTRNFVHGSPDHAVMVAELRDGLGVRSWIWQPQLEVAYVAERGGGSWRNGQRLSREPVAVSGSEVIAATSTRSWIGQQLGDVGPLHLTWVCCGVDYPKLIEGAADLLLYGTPLAWDHAPGALLVAEAGGYVGTVEGQDFSPQRSSAGLLVCGDRSTYDRCLGAAAALIGQ